MAKNERGLFVKIFREFIKSLTPKFSKTTCVGQDCFGTKYFEVNDSKYNSKRPSRYFLPIDPTKFDQDIPAEWEAWLRFRRNHPPSEIKSKPGHSTIVDKQINTTNLKTHISEKTNSVYNHNDLKSETNHASHNFPIYEEYKNYGRNYKNDK